MSSTIACYALNANGAKLARRIHGRFSEHIAQNSGYSVHIYVHEGLSEQAEQGEHFFSSLPNLIARTFHEYNAHIFIGAVGIAVRSIAPHIVHKGLDPAVVACDELGNYVISLLAGHWGGGNELAKTIAKQLGPSTKAIITTATDINNLPAVDMLAKEQGCIILDWDKIKHINAAILRQETVQLYDPLSIFNGYNSIFNPEHTYNDLTKLNKNLPTVGLDWRTLPEHPKLLRLAIPALCVGIGCKRHTRKEDILQAINESFIHANLEPKAIACLASVDIKADEDGLIQAAKDLGLPLRLFSAEAIADAPNITPSAMASQLFGFDNISVSEGSALLAAGGDTATLLLPKEKHAGQITIAIAVSEDYIPLA